MNAMHIQRAYDSTTGGGLSMEVKRLAGETAEDSRGRLGVCGPKGRRKGCKREAALRLSVGKSLKSANYFLRGGVRVW